MKNILKQLFLLTIFLLIFYYSINYNTYISHQIIYSCEIWLKKVVPSLFLSFILIDLLTNSSLPYYLNKYCKINIIYLLSIIAGSPSNAYILKNYNQDITKIISVNKYPSLIFTYNFLKIIFNAQIALKFILINIICNIILFIIIKPPKIEYKIIPQTNIIEVLLTSITKNIQTLLNILGTIIFFNILPITKIPNPYLKSFLLSFLEITNSFVNLSLTPLPFHLKILLANITLSTCGLCIEAQIKSVLKDTPINYPQYFKYRFWHLILSSAITAIYC